MVSGSKIMYMVMAFILGLTVGDTRAITRTIKSTVMESTPGSTADNMMVNGRRANSMVKERYVCQVVTRKEAAGKVDKESNGSIGTPQTENRNKLRVINYTNSLKWVIEIR